MRKKISKMKIREILEEIAVDVEEEAAAEALLSNPVKLEAIVDDVNEGTPLRLAIRQALQREVEEMEDCMEDTYYDRYYASYYKTLDYDVPHRYNMSFLAREL